MCRPSSLCVCAELVLQGDGSGGSLEGEGSSGGWWSVRVLQSAAALLWDASTRLVSNNHRDAQHGKQHDSSSTTGMNTRETSAGPSGTYTITAL
jgi:hypothetical protein